MPPLAIRPPVPAPAARALLLALLLLAACQSNERAESTAGYAGAPAVAGSGARVGIGAAPARIAVEAPSAAASGDMAVADSAVAAPGAEEAAASAAQSPSGIPTMLIRTGRATIEVDSLEPAIARVRAMVQQAGGYVAATNIESGKAQRRSATLELKIPNARFDQVTGALAPVGKVEGLTVSTENVGEEYVDLTARMENARRLEARLIQLLATRTGKLQDVLEVERELARVRGEIERHEGRLRYLRTQVAMSTLTVTVHEPDPVLPPHGGPSPIAEAFRQSWRNFVGFLAGVIASLGVVVPLGAIVAALWWATRKLRPVVARERLERPAAQEPEREKTRS